MKLLRNPVVVGILAAAAFGLVAYQILANTVFRGRPMFGGKKAATTTVAKTKAPAKTPPAAPKGKASSQSAKAGLPKAVIYTNLETALLPTQGVDIVAIEPKFNAWVTGPARDPFLLLQPVSPDASLLNTETNSPVPTWILGAIWHQTDSRLAVINNKIYRVGDVVQEGYKLIRIEKDEVWFQGPRRNERLGFPPPKKGVPPKAPKKTTPKKTTTKRV